MYEPTHFAKPANVPNSLADCKMGTSIGPSTLDTSKPPLMDCDGRHILAEASPNVSNTDKTNMEPKADAEMSTENEMEVRPTLSRMLITSFAAETSRSFLWLKPKFLVTVQIKFVIVFKLRIFLELKLKAAQVESGFFGIPIWWICIFLARTNTLFGLELLLKVVAFNLSSHMLPPSCIDNVFSGLIWRLNLQILVSLFSHVEILTILWIRRRDKVVLVICTTTTVFVNLINVVGLIDMGVLLNSNARFQWPEAFVRHLPKYGSDHIPLLLSFDPPGNWSLRRRPFRIQAIWLSHPDFHSFLNQNWPKNCAATAALAQLKSKLLRRNKLTFDNIQQCKTKIMADNQNWRACYR
ncbi:hypothetical protein V2J09_010557 [Rumex salicifolius]